MPSPQDPTAATAPPAGTVPTPWAAPTSGSVQATVPIPGSKSLTNRALVLAAQAAGPSTIGEPLISRDTQLMATALQTLGTAIGSTADADGGPAWRVTPAPLRGPATLDCGLAGTVMRFLPPLAATARGPITMDGDPQARVRPMGTVLSALRGLGVRVDGDSLPFTVHGEGQPAGGEVHIDASASSQFVSGLLLSGAGYRDGITVIHAGPAVPSMPHIQMTVQALRSVGVRVDDSEPDRWTVAPGPVAPWTAVIEPDLSNATPFLAAAAIAGGTVHIPNWPAQTTQPGDEFPRILAAMGVLVTQVNGGVSATGDGTIGAVDLDLHDVGELTPTVAALTLFADGPSRLHGIAHLRGHETDRLAALVADIRALGGDADQTDDGLVVHPVPLHGGLWRAYADHRMATAGALVGLRVSGVLVDDIDSTAKTLPGFDRLWAGLVADTGNRRVAGGSR